ncbi:MAG: hypothetical protein KIS92_25770 [Planctomycetota bacterium]|nr:hypothetical protein [Planctomycetota bacterium]
MTKRTGVPLCAAVLALAAFAAAEEPAPEELKQRIRELRDRIQRDDEAMQALKERVKEAEESTTVLRMVTEELAVRLEAYEKGASKEFEDRTRPEALRRLTKPVAAANVGDWVSYVKTVTAPDGTKTESTYKLSVAAKGKDGVTLRTEIERGGKTESSERVYRGSGPYDVFDPDGRQRRTAKSSEHETVTVGLAKYACLKVVFAVGIGEEGKAAPAGERVCWINLSIPLTGFAMAVHTEPNGERIAYALSGSGGP